MVKTLKRYIYLYFYMFKLNFKIKVEYKADFVISFLANIPIQIIEFLFIWVVFQNISSLAGWTFYEMALIYGIMTCSKGVAECFFDGFYDVSKLYMKTGAFDNIMVQPINSLFNVIAKSFFVGGLGDLAIGTTISVIAITNLNIPFGIPQIIFTLISIILGGLIFGGLMTIATSSSFWVVESLDILWTTYSLHQLGLYPINLYNIVIKSLVIFVFPYAFASYYPVTLLLGRREGNIAFLTPIIVILIWAIAIKTWKMGVKNYGSTGS